MRQTVYLITTLIFTLYSTAFRAEGQELGEREKAIIHTEAFNTIKRYEQVLNNLARSTTTDEAQVTKYKDEFISLFLNRQILVYNDLDPTHGLSEFYEVETYISNLALWYPDGLTAHLDFSDIQTPGIQPHKDNIWYIDINVNKKLAGNYMNRTINNNSEDLSFRIAFIRENKKLQNFQIVGVRNAKSETNISDDKALAELNKADYTDDELKNVHSAAKSLIMDYERALQFIGAPGERAEDKELFAMDLKSLFEKEDTKVFNDIEPKPEDELLDITTYLEKYISDYPAGVDNLVINSDSATYSHIEASGEERFQTFVYVQKFFSGKYKEKEKLSQANPLIFTIAFDKKEGVFRNFSIKSIDKEYTDFSGINIVDSDSESKLAPLQPIKREGYWYGINITGGMSIIDNKNISSQTLLSDFNEWETQPEVSYTAGLNLYKYFNENLGVMTGLQYSAYRTTYSISGYYEDTTFTYDVNSKPRQLRVDAEFDTVQTLKYLTVPLHMQYIKEKSARISYYINAGFNISYLLSSTFDNNGDYIQFGYYKQNEVEFQNIYFEELGYEVNLFDENGKALTKSVNIDGVLSLGILIKTGYFSSLKLGPVLTYGLTDINDYEFYINVFDKPYKREPTRIKNLGFEISFIQKL